MYDTQAERYDMPSELLRLRSDKADTNEAEEKPSADTQRAVDNA